MTQLTTLLDKLSPSVRLWLALVITIAGAVCTAVGGANSDPNLAAAGSALLLVGGIVAPTGAGKPPTTGEP
jgi:drug/metabolite transporter (DMT)-like permease